MNPPYYTARRYWTDRYGEPLYRVPIDPGFGCPHRNPDGSGGCTFCPEDGGRAVFSWTAKDDLDAQIRGGMAFAASRYGARRFMAYIQAFTGTFAPASAQRALYLRVLDAYPFDAVSIGTRPDCLPETTLDLLEQLKERLDVWVELGIQTFHDKTLMRLRRGHDGACGREAIRRLHERGIRIAVHVMLDLPGETREEMLETADTLASLPVDAVKIHNLHVIRGTQLAEEWRRNPFPLRDETAYADLLIDFLRRLPPEMGIFRINTDTPPDRLLAPRWRMPKAAFIQYVAREMHRRGVRQGDCLRTP